MPEGVLRWDKVGGREGASEAEVIENMAPTWFESLLGKLLRTQITIQKQNAEREETFDSETCVFWLRATIETMGSDHVFPLK